MTKKHNDKQETVKVEITTKHKKEPTRKNLTTQKNVFIGASPTKTKGVNKVFVTATTNGILLLRTEKPFSKDDAFTNTFNVDLLANPEYSAELNIQKVCDRRESSSKNTPIITSRGWNSKQYVSVNPVLDAENESFRKKWAENIVTALNKVDWTYGQKFIFCGDDTQNPIGKMDKYLLNQDIAGVLGAYIYEDANELLTSDEDLKNIFENEANLNEAYSILHTHWLCWTADEKNENSK